MVLQGCRGATCGCQMAAEGGLDLVGMVVGGGETRCVRGCTVGLDPGLGQPCGQNCCKGLKLPVQTAAALLHHEGADAPCSRSAHMSRCSDSAKESSGLRDGRGFPAGVVTPQVGSHEWRQECNIDAT
jgi:hypothetical protein